MLQSWVFFLAIVCSFKLAGAVVQCEQKNVIVELPATSPNMSSTNCSIATWFCWKKGTQLHGKKVVHLTLHGMTYDHTYWSFPYQSPKYSYVDYVIENSNGNIVVLNIDRLAVGLSSRPLLSTDVTIDSNAYVIYQLTVMLRQRVFQNIKFKKVILVGHSLGTVIGWRLLSDANYNKYTSGLIATGFLHVLAPVGVADFLASFYPAQFDPKFSQQSIPAGYVTTTPFNNTRRFLFYNTNNADPNVFLLDEQLKQTGTLSELSTVAPVRLPNVTQMIPNRIPVLVVMGQNDYIFCNAANITLSCYESANLIQREQPSYSYPIEAYVLQQSGHSINLHLNAHDWFQQALAWTQRRC